MRASLWALVEQPRRASVRYGLAVGMVVLATLAAAWLTDVSGSRFVTVYVVGVVLTSWLGGLGPGLLYTLLATLSLSLFFFPPIGTFALPTTPTDITTLILFWVISALISLVGERLRASTAAARRLADRSASERDQLRQVLDVLPVAVELADAGTGLYTLTNEASRALRGTELTGQPVSRGPSADLDARRSDGSAMTGADIPLQRALGAGETVLGAQYTIANPERGDIPVLVNAAPLKLPRTSTVVGAVSAYEDISQLRTLEQQRSQLLALLSHDLQQPLTAARAQVQLLRRRLDRDDAALTRETITAALERIELATAKLAEQVRELLDMTRLQGGDALDLNKREADVVLLVRAIVSEYEQTSDGYTIHLTCDSESLVANVDAARLRHAFGNVLSNAMKYSPTGSVVFVRLYAPTDADRSIRFEVEDAGMGIPASDLPFVFEPFRRGSNVGASTPGSGLGLAGARQIIAEHGGTIEVTSSEGRGTTAVVRLPAQTSAS